MGVKGNEGSQNLSWLLGLFLMRAFSLQADAQKDWTLVLDMHFDEEGGSFYW